MATSIFLDSYPCFRETYKSVRPALLSSTQTAIENVTMLVSPRRNSGKIILWASWLFIFKANLGSERKIWICALFISLLRRNPNIWNNLVSQLISLVFHHFIYFAIRVVNLFSYWFQSVYYILEGFSFYINNRTICRVSRNIHTRGIGWVKIIWWCLIIWHIYVWISSIGYPDINW